MNRKSLYRKAEPGEQMKRDVERVSQFENEPKVRPAKPPKGAKRKAKR